MNLLVTPNNDKLGIYDSTVSLCNALHELGAHILMLDSDREQYSGKLQCDVGYWNKLHKDNTYRYNKRKYEYKLR